MNKMRVNSIVRNIIDFYYENTENGKREVVFNLPLSYIELTPFFPYYDRGIRGLEFDDSRLKAIYVSMKFLSDEIFFNYYRYSTNIIVIDVSDYDLSSMHYYYSNMKFLDNNMSNLYNINLYLRNNYLSFNDLRNCRKYENINLIPMSNTSSITYSNKIVYDFTYLIATNLYLDSSNLNEFVDFVFDDIKYLLTYFNISGSLNIELNNIIMQYEDYLNNNTDRNDKKLCYEFLSLFIVKYQLLDEDWKAKFKRYINFDIRNSKFGKELLNKNIEFYSYLNSFFRFQFWS